MTVPHVPALLALALTLAAGCDDGATTPAPNGGNGGGDGDDGVALERVAEGLAFPLHVAAPPGDPRLFVVEKGGRVKIVEDGRVLDAPFLDLSGQVSGGSEQGLLSIAFHPEYGSNGRFYVDLTDPSGDTRVVEYRVSNDPDRADPASARTILTVDQPFSNHNGGLVVFGPDGMLYVGLGDGGSGGDPGDNGQDTGTLLGTILRIDVDAGDPYGIPPDNPLVDDPSGRDEIWAWGLRNPWRFAFDRETGDLYVADVGQNRFEEVNAVEGPGGGRNFGWNVMEGDACFEPREGCDRTGLTPPVETYGHSDGCSVTGGHVYRGEAIPALRGTYFYSDFCSGFVRSFRFAGGAATERRRWSALEPAEGSVSSFGEDAAGELYLTTSGGSVYRIVPR